LLNRFYPLMATSPEERIMTTQVSELATKVVGRPNQDALSYEELLAFYRGELDARACAKIKTNLTRSRRWRAHLDSVRSLDLERAAARQDAESLQRFDVANATPFCREVARSRGDVLLRFIRREQETALGEPRAAWDRHVNRCVYCRRTRRLMQARFVCETNDVPEGEPLLREWLLESYYRAALDEVTRKLLPDRTDPSGDPTWGEAGIAQEETVVESTGRQVAKEGESDTTLNYLGGDTVFEQRPEPTRPIETPLPSQSAAPPERPTTTAASPDDSPAHGA
jgi:hypothetical protein